MDRVFFSTIIKAILIIFFLHFIIKHINLTSNRTPSSVTNNQTWTELDGSDDESEISDISREELKRSLKDFVDVPITAGQNISLNHDDIADISSGYMPEDKAYADYRPLNMNEETIPNPVISLNVEAGSDAQPEKVSNGGPLMLGVYGYDETQDSYSMVFSPPETHMVKPVIS